MNNNTKQEELRARIQKQLLKHHKDLSIGGVTFIDMLREWEYLFNAEITSVLDEIEEKGRWDTAEAEKLPYFTREAIQSIKERYSE